MVARKVAEAVKAGAGLKELAVELARRVDDPESSASEVASCARELRMVIAALADQPAKTRGNPVDELRQRRARRKGA